MIELLRTNDITVTALARTLLDDADIKCFELDVNMSVLEGSIGILPRRLMVLESDLPRARRLMQDGGVPLDG